MREGFDLGELGKTLRNDVFATWFGWSVIVAVVVFPMTSMVTTCHSENVREEIAIAKLGGANPDRATVQTETLKWLVSRGVHPLVARCAILNSPQNQCAHMMTALEDEDRAIIEGLIRNPATFEVVKSTDADTGPVTSPPNPLEYIKGLDFGLTSPTK
jgi:hypothetical protein